MIPDNCPICNKKIEYVPGPKLYCANEAHSDCVVSYPSRYGAYAMSFIWLEIFFPKSKLFCRWTYKDYSDYYYNREVKTNTFTFGTSSIPSLNQQLPWFEPDFSNIEKLEQRCQNLSLLK